MALLCAGFTAGNYPSMSPDLVVCLSYTQVLNSRGI
jgi:hypothetical protein